MLAINGPQHFTIDMYHFFYCKPQRAYIEKAFFRSLTVALTCKTKSAFAFFSTSPTVDHHFSKETMACTKVPAEICPLSWLRCSRSLVIATKLDNICCKRNKDYLKTV